MKKIMMTTIGLLIGIGLAQSQSTDEQKIDSSQDGPKIEQVDTEQDFYGDMQKSAKKEKEQTVRSQQEKTALIKEMERTNPEFKYYPTEKVKSNKDLIRPKSDNFGQGKDQVFSRTKTTKKIGYVDGIAPREEIKKIDGHAPISADALIQALGNPKPVKNNQRKPNNK